MHALAASAAGLLIARQTGDEIRERPSVLPRHAVCVCVAMMMMLKDGTTMKDDGPHLRSKRQSFEHINHAS